MIMTFDFSWRLLRYVNVRTNHYFYQWDSYSFLITHTTVLKGINILLTQRKWPFFLFCLSLNYLNLLNWKWCLKSYQHILGYLMTFPVLLVEENLRIIQTEKNHCPPASNWKLPHIKFSERAGLEPTTLAVRGKSYWDEGRCLRSLGHGGSPYQYWRAQSNMKHKYRRSLNTKCRNGSCIHQAFPRTFLVLMSCCRSYLRLV